ncbi:MAG: hypothetical protein ACLUHE_01950 [Christensenellales bacterium]
MNVALGNEFDHLRQVLAETGVEQQKTQQELRAATEAIGQMTQDVVNMHQLSQGVLEHFRAYVADMDASRAQVDDTNRKTIELLEAMGKTSGQQALYLAKLQEYQAALTAASQQYTAWTDRFLASAQEQTRITGKEMDRVVGRDARGQPDALRRITSSSPSRRRRIWRARPRCLTRASLPPSTSSTRRWIPCAT